MLIGSIPGPEKDEDDKDIKERVKANILTILSQEYGVDEDDFLSAEIEVVPAGEARDYGLDRSMIMGYGHDDRVCAYPSYRAMLEIEAHRNIQVYACSWTKRKSAQWEPAACSHAFSKTVWQR